MRIQVQSDADAAATAGAKFIADQAREAVAARGRFVMAVSGGHVPWQMFRILASDPVLDVTDRDFAVTGAYQERQRMTLTYPILNRARCILWLVTGPEKAEILQRLANGDESIPAGRIRRDTAVVLADRAATSNTSATGTKGI